MFTISGKGNSVNVSSNLCDILKILGINSCKMRINVNENINKISPLIKSLMENLGYDSSRDMLRKINEKLFNDKLIPTTYREISKCYFNSNHTINGIDYNGLSCYIDLVNHKAYMGVNKSFLVSYYGTPLLDDYIDPSVFIYPVIEKGTKVFGSDNFALMYKLLSRKTVGYDYLQDEYTKGMIYASENKDYIDKMYEDNKSSYEKITNDLITLEKSLDKELLRRVRKIK